MGVARLITRLRWTDDGRLAERMVLDGRRDLLEAERFDYDEHGQLAWSAKSIGAGWRTSRYTLDDLGQPVAIATELDGDCTADELTELVYVDDVRLESATTRAGDEIVREDTYAYDDAGRLLRFTRREGDAGEAELAEHRFDAQGRQTYRRVRERRSIDDKGTTYVFDDWTRTRFDAQGRVSAQVLKNGEFGPEEEVRYEYACRKRYRRFPPLDPFDDPELAEYCYDNFE